LHFKSGVRFDLANQRDGTQWRVAFYFGTSKSINQVLLDADLYKKLTRRLPKKASVATLDQLSNLREFLRSVDTKHLQRVWSHSGPGATRPFDLLDRLGESGAAIASILDGHFTASESMVIEAVRMNTAAGLSAVGLGKVLRNAPAVLAGLL